MNLVLDALLRHCDCGKCCTYIPQCIVPGDFRIPQPECVTTLSVAPSVSYANRPMCIARNNHVQQCKVEVWEMVLTTLQYAIIIYAQLTQGFPSN